MVCSRYNHNTILQQAHEPLKSAEDYSNMKKPKTAHNHFFVDESGDSTFYDKRGD